MCNEVSKGNSRRKNGRNKSVLFALVVLIILIGVDYGVNGSQGTLVQSVKTYLFENFGIFEEVEESQVPVEKQEPIEYQKSEKSQDSEELKVHVEPQSSVNSKQNTKNYTSSKLHVYFYDVGQADSILILLDGKALLVDSGNAGDAALDDKIKNKINLTHELKRLGVEELDAVGTHAHEDHIGSLYKICEMFEINNLYMNSFLPEEEQARYYQRLVAAIIENDIHMVVPTILTECEIKEEIESYNNELMAEYEEQVKKMAESNASEEEMAKLEKPELAEYHAEDYIRVGDTIPFGNAKITMIAPNSAEYSDTNDYSIVLMVEFEDVKLLLTGDAGEKAEEEILEYAKNNNFDLNCDILKVGHHGSRTASTEAFISEVDPEYAIVMVAEENSYGLPDEDVLERLDNQGATIYQTKDKGDIHLIIDDGSFEFDFDFSHEVKGNGDKK